MDEQERRSLLCEADAAVQRLLVIGGFDAGRREVFELGLRLAEILEYLTRPPLPPCPHCSERAGSHYVGGHLACRACGRSLADCCEGERAGD